MGQRLGQHFLTDRAMAEAIAAAATIGPDEPVLEIGPGRGALTEHLLGRGRRLLGVELDERLAERLRQRHGAALELLQADILDVRLADLGETARWVVMGNIPYYITSDILLWLAGQHTAVARSLLMMQHEVAQRLTAAPGDSAYGRLTVSVGYRFDCTPVLAVPPGCFQPPPRVQSTVVRLEPWPAPPVAVRSERALSRLVEHGFRWRRKMLSGCLNRWLGCGAAKSAEWLAAAGVEPTRRAETLSLAEFAAVTNHLVEVGAVKEGGEWC